MEYVRLGFDSLNSHHRQQIREFVVGQMGVTGGFYDREGCDDLYYTVFGLQLLQAANIPIPFERISGYLQGFYGKIDTFDLLEVASLGRCLGMLPLDFQFGSVKARIAQRIKAFTSVDGGFSMSQGSKTGSVYASFIAIGALEDMDLPIDNSSSIVSSIQSLSLPDGAYVNDHDMPIGLVPSTAAAIVLLTILQGCVSEKSFDWLMSCLCPDGGFAAVPGGEADLLSTAVALYALQAGPTKSISGIRDAFAKTAYYVDSMKAENGAFYGSSEDKYLDCEYCYYGLLACGITSAAKH